MSCGASLVLVGFGLLAFYFVRVLGYNDRFSMLTRCLSGGASSLISLKALDFSETTIPFYIPTDDGNRLYAWLVTPLQIYASHESIILQDSAKLHGDIRDRVAFSLLADDPKSRVIIYFHGNAGTVGQTRRTDAYRMISSGTSDPLYVLAFDYRGFGSSSGTPTEGRLTQDAIDVIIWVIEVANIPADRILLVAQSLGTVVACAAADHFINKEHKIEIAGSIICATFATATTMFLNYSIGGYFNHLAPLR